MAHLSCDKLPAAGAQQCAASRL